MAPNLFRGKKKKLKMKGSLFLKSNYLEKCFPGVSTLKVFELPVGGRVSLHLEMVAELAESSE